MLIMRDVPMYESFPHLSNVEFGIKLDLILYKERNVETIFFGTLFA